MNERESREEDPLEKDERDRSNFVREIVQRPNELGQVPATLLATPPKRIVQFWDDLDRLPEDVRECMESWKKLEQSGFELQVFDESSAREFIRVHLGSRHVNLNFQGRGFINNIADLSAYAIEHSLDGFAIEGRSYMMKPSKTYQAYLKASHSSA